MTTIIIGAAILIAVLVAITNAVRAYNAPKTEAAKALQEAEATKQKEAQVLAQKQRQDTRVVIIDKRLGWREKLQQWRNERRAGRRG